MGIFEQLDSSVLNQAHVTIMATLKGQVPSPIDGNSGRMWLHCKTLFLQNRNNARIWWCIETGRKSQAMLFVWVFDQQVIKPTKRYKLY